MYYFAAVASISVRLNLGPVAVRQMALPRWARGSDPLPRSPRSSWEGARPLTEPATSNSAGTRDMAFDPPTLSRLLLLSDPLLVECHNFFISLMHLVRNLRDRRAQLLDRFKERKKWKYFSSATERVGRGQRLSHYYPGSKEGHIPTRSASFDVALLWTGFITRPGIPWGNCYG